MSTSEITTENRTRNRATLLLIAATFFVPIVIAWLYATGVFNLNGRGRLNHGELLSPPIALTEEAMGQAIRPLLALPPADWATVLVTPGRCDEGCEKILRDLAVIRTLVGKEATRVSIFGIAGEASRTASAELPRLLVSAEATGAIFKAVRAPAAFIGFVDSQGYLMMRFPTDAAPGAIKEDLQRLLRASALR